MKIIRIPSLALACLGLVFSSSCGGGGGGGSSAPIVVSATLSTMAVDYTFGAPADGLSLVTVTVTVRDESGLPAAGQRVSLAATGLGNVIAQPAGTTGIAGEITGTLATTTPEIKTITATINPGIDQVVMTQTAQAEFIMIPPGSRYVREDGDDANGGTSPIDAWRSLARAALLVQPGETVYVGAGTYVESVDIRNVGTAIEPIHFMGDVDGAFTGAAGRVIVDAQGADYGFKLEGAEFVLIDGFTVTGATPGLADGAGIWIDGVPSSNVILARNEVFGNQTGILVDDVTDLGMESNRISNNTGDGVELRAATGIDLANNLVYNNGGRGIFIGTGSDDVTVRSSTLYQNTGDQIFVEGIATSATLVDNVLTEGFENGITFPFGAAVTETNNLVFAHAGQDLEDGGGAGLDPTSMIADPSFIDPTGLDGLLGGTEGSDDVFMITTVSPAVNAGSSLSAVSSLRTAGSLAGMTTLANGKSDGGLLNLGMHEPIDFDDSEPIVAGEGRMIYLQDDVRPHGRTLDGNGSWTDERRNPPANLGARWALSRVSPVDGDTEISVVLSAAGGQTDLDVRVWDGHSWQGENPFDPIDSDIAGTDADQRGFDLEFEALSGGAMLVISDGTTNPRFRTFEGGLWSAEADVFQTPLAGGKILWVELVSRPGTDEIALVALDDTQNLFAGIWDGSAWEAAPSLIDTVITTTTESQAFGAEYEAISGDLLVVWGHELLIEEARFAERDAATGVWSNGLINAAEATVFVVRLAADPTSDQIVAAFAEGVNDDDTIGLVWDGSSFGHIVEFDLSSGMDQNDLSVGWVGDAGVAVLIYKDDDAGGLLSWARFDDAGWRRKDDVAIPGADRLAFSTMCPTPGAQILNLLYLDEAGSLYGLQYDGSDWTLTNAGAPLATEVPVDNGPAEGFDLDFRR